MDIGKYLGKVQLAPEGRSLHGILQLAAKDKNSSLVEVHYQAC
jgi:hypothetical protein